jgi:hypothetical protein
MRERPILFSGPMVRAILDGRKTQTRRVLKPQPFDDGYFEGDVFCDFVPAPASNQAAYARFSAAAVGGGAVRTETYEPRHKVGDRLWVREAWTHTGDGVWTIADARFVGSAGVRYHADGPVAGAKYWPSIHMPREFSRISLDVTSVKVERLQSISEAEAVAEGCRGRLGPNPEFPDEWDPSPQEEFRDLWDHINGPGSWEANPWVVAIAFRVVAPDQASAGGCGEGPPSACAGGPSP